MLLTTAEEYAPWLTEPVQETFITQRSWPDVALMVVAQETRHDGRCRSPPPAARHRRSPERRTILVDIQDGDAADGKAGLLRAL